MPSIVRYEPGVGAPSPKVSNVSPSSGITQVGQGIQQMTQGFQQAAYTMALQGKKTNEEALHGTSKMEAAKAVGDYDAKYGQLVQNTRATRQTGTDSLLDFIPTATGELENHLREVQEDINLRYPNDGARIWSQIQSAFAAEFQQRRSAIAADHTKLTAEFSQFAYAEQTKDALASVFDHPDVFEGKIKALHAEGTRMAYAGTLDFKANEDNVTQVVLSGLDQIFQRNMRDDPQQALSIHGELVNRFLPILTAQGAAKLEASKLINRDAFEKEQWRQVDEYNEMSKGGGPDALAIQRFKEIGIPVGAAMRKRHETANFYRNLMNNHLADEKANEERVSSSVLSSAHDFATKYMLTAGPDKAKNYANLEKAFATFKSLMTPEDKAKAESLLKTSVENHGIKFDDTLAKFNIHNRIQLDPYDPKLELMVARGQFLPETKSELLSDITRMRSEFLNKDKATIHEALKDAMRQADDVFDLNPTEVSAFSKLHMRNRIYDILLYGDKAGAPEGLKREYASLKLNPTAYIQSFYQREAAQAQITTIRQGRDIIARERKKGFFIDSLHKLASYAGDSGGYRFNTKTTVGQDEYKAAAMYLSSLVANPAEQKRLKGYEDEYRRQQQIEQEEADLLEQYKKQRK